MPHENNIIAKTIIDFAFALIKAIPIIITHLAGQTYVWHCCKWNFAGPQIYLQPAKIKSQYFGVSLKFLFVIESISYED